MLTCKNNAQYAMQFVRAFLTTSFKSTATAREEDTLSAMGL